MPTPKLDNYLRTFRKTRGFTQREVAFLLGCHNAEKVSRYEHSKRVPALETIFAYATIFGIPAQELFAGIQERAQRHAIHRARLLARRLERQTKNPVLARKVDFLRAVADGNREEPRYEEIPQA